MICTVSDCIVEINKIETLIDRYKLGANGGVFINESDATKIRHLLLNYKDILVNMEVHAIHATLFGNGSEEKEEE